MKNNNKERKKERNCKSVLLSQLRKGCASAFSPANERIRRFGNIAKCHFRLRVIKRGDNKRGSAGR